MLYHCLHTATTSNVLQFCQDAGVIRFNEIFLKYDQGAGITQNWVLSENEHYM